MMQRKCFCFITALFEFLLRKMSKAISVFSKAVKVDSNLHPSDSCLQNADELVRRHAISHTGNESRQNEVTRKHAKLCKNQLKCNDILL